MARMDSRTIAIIGPYLIQDGEKEHRPPQRIAQDGLLFADNAGVGFRDAGISVSEVRERDGHALYYLDLPGSIKVIAVGLATEHAHVDLEQLKKVVDDDLQAKYGQLHSDEGVDYPSYKVLWWHSVLRAERLTSDHISLGLTDGELGQSGGVAVRSGQTFIAGAASYDLTSPFVNGVTAGLALATATWIEADRADRLADDISARASSDASLERLEAQLLRCHKRLREARYLDGTSRVTYELAIREWTIVGAIEGAMTRLSEQSDRLQLAASRRRTRLLDVVASTAGIIGIVALIDFASGPELSFGNGARDGLALAILAAGIAIALTAVRRGRSRE